MKILFYGRLAETIGPQLDIYARPGCSIAELRERLIAEHPRAQEPLRNHGTRACIGDKLVRDDYAVQPADRVEFLPPVSGG
jgi:molybdopterin converting factor small subunit